MIILACNVIEFPERLDVVNIKSLPVLSLWQSTRLALVAIALSRLSSLRIPVWAVIASVFAALPLRVIVATLVYGYPFTVANMVAKMIFVVLYMALGSLKSISAMGALYIYPFPCGIASAFTISLPRHVAFFATKIYLTLYVAWQTAERLTASVTCQGYQINSVRVILTRQCATIAQPFVVTTFLTELMLVTLEASVVCEEFFFALFASSYWLCHKKNSCERTDALAKVAPIPQEVKEILSVFVHPVKMGATLAPMIIP